MPCNSFFLGYLMPDMSRHMKNLIFFTIGLFLPLLIFQPAFADEVYDYYDGLSTGDNFSVGELCYTAGSITKTYNVTVASMPSPNPRKVNQYVYYYTVAADWIAANAEFWAENPTFWPAKCDLVRITVGSAVACIDPDPASWTNGIKDPDEDGIDCGGDTGVACTEACENTNLTPFPDGLCYDMRVIQPDEFGDCPIGWTPDVEGPTNTSCNRSSPSYTEPVVLVSPDYTFDPDDPLPDPFPNPWNEASTTTDTTITASTVTDPDGTVHDISTTATVETDSDGNARTIEKVVDTATAPDGSKTITTTINTTNNGDSSSDSATTSNINIQTFDADGNLVAESNEATATEADPDQDRDLAAGAPSTDEFLTNSDDIDFQPLVASLEVAADKWPFNVPNTMVGFYEMLDVEPAAPSFDLQLLGKTFVVDLSIFDPVASVLRFLLGTLITLGLFYYIVHFYRGVS